MAYLNRIPKIGSNWTTYELLAYNIKVSLESPLDFFGYDPDNANTLLDTLDPHLVSDSLDQDRANLSLQTSRFLNHLDYASSVNVGKETSPEDFLRELLLVTEYEEHGLYLRSSQSIPLGIYGMQYSVRANVCLVKHYTILLLVVQASLNEDPEPAMIAAAIGAFQFNNRERENAGLPRLDEMVIPCITMTGTRPAFYKVPVSDALSTAVLTAQYPYTPMNVIGCCVPPRRAPEGMESPVYRKKVLEHLVAFRPLAMSLWQKFLV